MDERAQAIERLYRGRYGAFRNVAAAVVVPDQAHDAVQEGFARALAARRDLRHAPLEACVWRIVLRTSRLRGGAARTSLGPEPGLAGPRPDATPSWPTH